MGILSNSKKGTVNPSTPKGRGILASKRAIKTAAETYQYGKITPKLDTNGIDMFAPKPKPEPKTLLQLSQGAQEAMYNAPVRTPIDQRLNLFPGNEKADNRKYIGSNLIPAYKEDKPLAKVGKGVVNYGIGGALSLLGNVGGAPQQAMMQTSRAGTNAVLGKPQQTSEMSLRNDLLPKQYDKALTNLANKGTIGKIASTGIDMLVNTASDPTTIIGGGIVDDLSRAGIMGKASRPSTEMVQVLGDSQQKLLAKMRAKLPLTQVEIETVNNTPELKALPEAKQYLMLPEGRITTPDVIEALPPKPTLDDLDVLKRKPSNAPMNKNYPNLETMDATELKALSSELNANKENLINEQIKWLKETSGNGVEQGKLFRGDMGEVVGRQGRISKNDKWYQDWARENGYRKLRQSDYREIAEKQLREGYNTSNGFVPPDENFNFTDEFVKNADIELSSPARRNEALNKAKQYIEAKENIKYNVPEQYRKETPFTVSRSTVPPKVEAKFAKESFDPLGGKLPKAEPKPIGGELPKPANKVVIETPKERFSFKKAWDKFYTSTIDNQAPISGFSKKAGDSTATLASNSRNAGGTVDYILKDALVDRQGNKIGSSLREVAEQIPKGKEEDFWTYMSQRHNIDRAREGKHVIPNYTPEMSAQAVKEIEALNPVYKAIGDDVTNWIDSFMKEWGVNAGTVDSEVYDSLRQTYKSYFPTQREFSQLEQSMPDGVRKQFVDVSSPLKKATGSERDINNPLENIMNLVNRNVKAARYNEVGQSLLESVRQAPDKLREFAEVIPTQEGMFANTDNVISVLEGGKPVYLQINNKELLDAMKGLPKVVNNAKAMRAFTNVFKGLITQKNPLFAIRNIARDVPTAYVYGSTKNPVKFGADLFKAGKDILTNSENFQRYKAVGGGGANFFKGDAVKSAKELTKKGFHPLNAIETFNNITETAPRLAEFNRIFDKTGDVQKALAAANDVTVNFARGGNVTKAMEPFVPYLNAGVQGLDKFFKGFKNPKAAVSTLIKGGIAITAPEIALYMVNKDDPAYQELDNRTKDTYFLIPKGDGTFWKIPKSRELGVLFGSLFQRIMRANDGEDLESAFKGYGNSLATSFAPANPLENNIASPIFNLKSNKDFAGRSIVPQGMIMDKRSPYLQYDERTSEIAKAIGNASKEVVEGGLSPKQIDYLIRSYTGVIGQLGIPATTKGGSVGKTISTQFTSDPLYSSQTLTNFYDNYDKLQTEATDRNIVDKLPTNGKKNIVTEEEKLRNQFSKASAEISSINKEIKQIETTFDPFKETRVRELRQKIQDIARAANESLK